VYGLRVLRDENAYHAVVWRLALRVVELCRSHWVEPRRYDHVDQLRNAFSEELA
jgi:hypothetical protein